MPVLLPPGSRLGSFEIISSIGSGGMGHVYKARDIRLNRIVAIKVLLDSFAAQPDARARFEREAKAIAGLNHPHICTIHDVGRDGDVDFIVLELLEGETLAERLARGPLPIDDALQCGVEIADALAKAHSQGIAHRDLKPGNVMLTKSGVKLLDFGLAKALSAETGDHARTVTREELTAEGMVLGTLQYMAPEQLETGRSDSRSDIFAFGTVLHEMLTGRKAFEGNSRISLASAIVRDTPPPVSTLVATTGDRAAGTKRLRTLDRLVATCLAKDPEDRWQATRDLWRELKWIARSEGKDEDGRGPASTSEAIRPRARRQIPLAWSAALTAIAAMLAAIAVWMAMPRSQQTTDTSPVMQVAVSLPRGEELAHFGAFALSSDGARIAYVSTRAGQAPRLHVRTMASGAIVDIPGGDGAFEPFFSPDDQWIGFFANGKLKKALANGGAAQTLCDAVAPMGGAWGPDDTIYFAPFNTSGLWSVSSAGGTPKAITSLNRGTGETSHRWPHVLPGGTAILFTIWTGPGWDEHELQVLTLATGERRKITRGATAGQYVASGHIVYSRADVLMAVPFDLSRLQATAAPYELRERVLEEDGSEFAVSATGLLAYVAVSPQRLQRQLVWVDGNGHVDEIPASPRPYLDPAVSPDGRLAVVSVQGPVQTLWVYDFARRTLTPLTSANVGSSQAPVWTPDGTRLAYRGTRHGFRNLFVRSGDGSDDEERLTTSENLQTPSSWTPDGRNLVYMEVAPDTGADIFVLSLDGRTSKSLIRTPATERNPSLSPDGRWLAYASNESGADEVYVRPFAGAGARLQVSIDGGSEPSWSRHGLRLIYRSKDQIMAAPIVTQPRLSADASVVLFSGRYSRTDTAGTPGYGIGPDDRLLMVQPLEPEQPATVINLVTNWFDEIRSHAPTRP